MDGPVAKGKDNGPAGPPDSDQDIMQGMFDQGLAGFLPEKKIVVENIMSLEGREVNQVKAKK